MIRAPHPASPSRPAAPAVMPFNLVGTLLLTGLLSALVVIGSGLATRLLPGWHAPFLPAAAALVACEAALVRYRMHEGRHLAVGALPYLAAELFALLVLMRVVASLSLEQGGFAETARAWVRSPLAALDAPFLVCLAVGLVVALAMRAGLRELAVLEPRAAIRAPEYALDAAFYRAACEADEREALARLTRASAWGGALALVVLVAQVANLESVLGPPHPLAPAVALAGITYLACAILLYSRARLGLLRARWTRDGATVERAVPRRWHWTGLALVAAALLVGLLLPRSYGYVLLDLARGGGVALINLVGLAALWLGVLALGVLGLALTIPALLLALLMRPGAQPIEPGGPLLPTPLPPAPPAPTQAPPLLPGLVFWLCMGLLAAYALWIVLRRQEWAITLWARLRTGALSALWAWLRGLWGGAAAYARQIGAQLGERLRPSAPPASGAPPRLNLRRLGPGELVRYFYTSTLHRAARLGLGRRSADAPYEYGARLRNALPEAEEDIARLTEAYVAATYAPQPATRADAARARGPWERLRRRLRGR